jgi:hypothetical protein
MDLSFLFSAVSLILWGFSFLFFRAYLRRRTGPERLLAEYREEVDKLTADIDAITDRDAGLIADRVKTLRELLENVDRRIAVYTREVNREKTQEAAYTELGLKRSVLKSGEPRSMAPPAFVLPETGETGLAGSPEKTETRESPELPPESSEAASSGGEGRFVRAPRPIEPKPPSFAEQVEKLARAGLSSELIASRLGTTLAEVDLAIALLPPL